jgi:hypothetical protein
VLDPIAGAAKLEPIEPGRLDPAAAQREIEIAISIQVRERGQAIVARAFASVGRL